MFKILLSETACAQLDKLRSDQTYAARAKAVDKTISLLTNPKHPGLQSHEFTSLHGPLGEKVFEAYAQQNTPAAYRVFWYYGPHRKQITVISITAHP
jgi:hypothetical protein